MGPFYSRFVPATSINPTSSVHEAPILVLKKRKFEDEKTGPRQDIKKSKKTDRHKNRSGSHEGVVEQDNADHDRKQPWSEKKRPGIISPHVEKLNGSSTQQNDGESVLSSEKQSVTGDKKERKNRNIQQELQGSDSSPVYETLKQNGSASKDGSQPLNDKKKDKKKTKLKKATERQVIESKDTEDHSSQLDPHVSIRSKLEKSKKALDDLYGSEHDDVKPQDETSPPVELHGLEPLPQPTPVQNKDERPTFSSLPPWLANPLRVDSVHSLPFSTLLFDAAVLENVKKQGLENAFPVQSAVIPLLTDGSRRHSGDVCISAATGSGKTLAYVLPMIQHLRNLATTKLRGLIVVPTRELVRQARETCETSAAGTSIKITTALGSRSLHDEQQALVESYEVYNPVEYRKQQDAPINWSQFDLEEILSEFENEKKASPNFITRYRSKVDVLICTPGRLVDHIRSTKGFTLDDVQWLVIDEADRLLNESFQEWTEIVIPALQSRAAHALQDNILRHMRLEIPERIVQKVIMSATMTQDVSKLNSLKLRNPKLVVVGVVAITDEMEAVEGSALEPHLGEGATFNLPSTLSEYAVAVGDGAEKPLYLLELLRTKVDVFNLENSEQKTFDKVDKDDRPKESKESNLSDSDSEPDSASESTTSSSTSSRISFVPRAKTHNTTTPPTNNPTSSYNNTALIFTRSTESATRLSRLLSLLSTPISSLTTLLTKSSSSSSSTRKALLNFRNHKIRIIIATDRASRGLDLPGLGHVISYDVPTSMTTYVHRVGRTARAGKDGTAWTLLAHREARWFWREIGKGIGGEVGRIVRKEKVRRCVLNLKGREGERDGMRERYERALKTLGEEVLGGKGSARAK